MAHRSWLNRSRLGAASIVRLKLLYKSIVLQIRLEQGVATPCSGALAHTYSKVFLTHHTRSQLLCLVLSHLFLVQFKKIAPLSFFCPPLAGVKGVDAEILFLFFASLC